MLFATSDPIPAQHFDTSDIAFTEIDKEIAILKERVRILHAFRNTFTPIYRLPPEILARIFSFTRYSRAHRAYRHQEKPPSWTIVTRISQHWRNIALASPHLWSRISNSYQKYIFIECFRRSKAAALSVRMRKMSSEDGHLLGESLVRIRKLDLELGDDVSWNTMKGSLSSPAPLLESLSISASIPSPLLGEWDARPEVNLLSTHFFAGITPRLERLDLSGCSVNIRSSIFANLTALRVYDPPQRLSSIEVLAMLRRVPRLTSLTLSNVLDYDAAGLTSSDQEDDIVALSSLQSFSIEGRSFVQDLELVSQIAFPANSALHFYSDTTTREPLTILRDFIKAHRTVRQPAQAIIQSTPPLAVTLECSSDTLQLAICSWAVRKRDLITFEVRGRWTGALEISDTPEIAFLFSYLPLSDCVSFTTNCNIDVKTWTRVFGPLSKLECISVSGDHSINLISSLVNDFKNKHQPVRERKKGQNIEEGGGDQQMQTPSQGGVADFIFPALRSLDFKKMAFPEGRKDIITMLRARKRAGKKLLSIELSECPDFEDLMGTLQNVVTHVWWDGWDVEEDERETELDVYESDTDDSEDDDKGYMI